MAKSKKHMFKIERINKSTIIFDGVTVYRDDDVQSNRYVFFTDDYVIKFDSGTRGWSHQCADEAYNYDVVKKTGYKKYFAKLLQAGTIDGVDYVVQERIYSDFDHDYDNVPTNVRRTLTRIENKFGFNDLHEGNWTVLLPENKVIIYDYAG